MKKKNEQQQELIPADEKPTEFFEVEQSRPDPQRGFPELWWKGKRPFNGVHYYPAQHKESHGDAVDGWRNQLYWGDNLQVMGHLLRRFRGQVQLVYIDPPFDSKADYKKKVKLRGQVLYNDSSAFQEKQYSDIWTNDDYLQFLSDRLALLRELLAPAGTIYVHMGPPVAARVRLLMDEIFGPENYLNTVIWSYRRWPSVSQTWQTMHDELLVYQKAPSQGATRIFNTAFEDASDSYLKRFGGKTQILDSESGTRKIPVDEPTRGMPLRDVWDMSILAGSSNERTGYPTQKPEALLERIISAASTTGGLVLDCFVGSGTSAAVAQRLGRRFIGSDINLGAIQTTTSRLRSVLDTQADLSFAAGENRLVGAGFDIYTVNQYDVFRNEIEARELLMEALAIRPLAGDSIWHGELGEGTETRLVRILPVNRIATRADLAPIVQNLDYRQLARRRAASPNKPVERITLLCMGHEPDLAAELITEIRNSLNDPGCKVDVEVVDILRDKDHIQFKRDSEARISVKKGRLTIERFYPMNLLQKLSMEKAAVSDWRELVDSVLVDFNFDGAVLRPSVTDIPERGQVVAGEYEIPEGSGTIRVKITDVLSDVFETSIEATNG